MTLRTFFTATLIPLALTACGSKPTADLYVLRAPDSGPTAVCTATHTIVVDRPAAPDEYDTKRIAVMLDHNHLSYYTGASWASPFPEQLQSFLSDALAARGLTVLDGDAAEGSVSVLHVTVREADITDLDTPVVHLRLTGTIGKKRFTINESAPAEQNHMPQIIDAYDIAAGNAVDDILHALKSRCPGVYAGD